jgi:hypothetical protein
MGIGRWAIASGILAAALCGFAHAQTGPVVVVPGKPGVPVIINGVEVNGAVVYGDWGLARPGHGQIIIDGTPMFGAPAVWRGYYPIEGRAPRYGRREIVPPHRLRPRPTDYRRSWAIESWGIESWGIESGPHPATEYPPFDPPPVILAPRPRR